MGNHGSSSGQFVLATKRDARRTMAPQQFLKWLGWWKVCAAIAVLVVVTCVLRMSQPDTQLEATLQAIRARGEPVSESEWNDQFAEKHDVYRESLLWKQALASARVTADSAKNAELNYNPPYEEAFIGRNEVPPLGTPWPQLDAAILFLAEHSSEIESIHTAADSGQLALYPFDFDDMGSHAEKAWAFYECGGLLSLESLVHMHQGKTVDALNALKALHAVAKAMEGNPSVGLYLMRLTVEGKLYRCALECIHDKRISELQLAELLALIQSINHQQNLKAAILGHRIYVLGYLETASIKRFRGFNFGVPLQLPGTTKAKVRYVGSSQQAIAEVMKPMHVTLRNVAAIDTSAKTNASFVDDLRPIANVGHSFECRYAAFNLAYARCLEALIGVEMYRREHGRIPKSPEELSRELFPQKLLDPFDGRQLRYLVEDSGVTVYSVGENLRDDGGAIVFSPKVQSRLDLGFKLRTSPSQYSGTSDR